MSTAQNIRINFLKRTNLNCLINLDGLVKVIAKNQHPIFETQFSVSEPTTHRFPLFQKVVQGLTIACPLVEQIAPSLNINNNEQNFYLLDHSNDNQENKTVTLTTSTTVNATISLLSISSSGQSSGVFEILAVSKKDDEEDDNEDEFEKKMDDFNEKNFADSGYFVTSTSTSQLAPITTIRPLRSTSVMEYYSNSGCYTCITGECLLSKTKNENKSSNDDAKKFNLCASANCNDLIKL